MILPTFKEGALPRRKKPGVDLLPEDSMLPVEEYGIHNSTPPSLADGDVTPRQVDDLGNSKVAIGDPAQLAELANGSKVAVANASTAVSALATSTTVLAANTDRKSAMIINDSDEVVYLKYGSGATLNSGIRLNELGGSIVETIYIGIITAICVTGSKNLTVTEL